MNDLILSASEREHVILAYLNNSDRFNILKIEAPPEWHAYPLSLALDTKQDFARISEIIRELSKIREDYSLEDILSYLRNHPVPEERPV